VHSLGSQDSKKDLLETYLHGPQEKKKKRENKKTNPVIAQGPLQAVGWKKKEGTEGDPMSSTTSEARRAGGADFSVLELATLAVTSAVSGLTHAG